VEIAGRDFKHALQTLRRLGVLMETDANLPSVAGLVTGEPVRGSWWSDVSAQEIFTILGQFEDHCDVMFTKLISGKVTLVHRKLWPEVLAIGSSRALWQMKELSKSARHLMELVDERGSVRTDQLAWPKARMAKPGEAARELEKRLLIYSGQFHTESGAHAKLLETWDTWARRVRFAVGTMQVESAIQKMEARVRKLNEQFEAAGRLPWRK
jgi:hypothetical protein